MAKANIDIKGLKELNQMFQQLPKQINKDKIWLKFWRENSKPALKAARANVPKKTGVLEKSIQFFTTKASKKFKGGYVGPRVKGAFRKKGKSGFYGAWVEYGSEVKFGGKGFGKDQPFMKPAWNQTKTQMLNNSMKDAEKVMARAIKSHEKRLKKYGKFGY
tara:strand:- start:375 stop:857 length:483 start_codon:yes stop_codon:yes gene_type:complete